MWLALLAVGLPGCLGVAEPPRPPAPPGPGEVVAARARADRTPPVARLEVRPRESTAPARSQVVLIATVRDADGKPLPHARVEWMLEGAGNIIEVDEGALFTGRGKKVDNRYAVSYTDHRRHTVTPHTGRPTEDFVLDRGETWCVISSAFEGDTEVTAYAPEIPSWQANRLVISQHWVDAEWQLPAAASTRYGGEAVLSTHVARMSDHQPLTFYQVRYRVLDGPPVALAPAGTSLRVPTAAEAAQEALTGRVAVSDLSGNAVLRLAQLTPQAGRNRIGVEIIRNPDPRAPSGTALVIGRGEATIDWLAPQVSLSEEGPQSVVVGQDAAYTLRLNNAGGAEARSLTVRTSVPTAAGMMYVRSEPPGVIEGDQLIWTLGQLPAGGARELKAIFRTTRVGEATARAGVDTAEGLHDEKALTTQVTPPPAPKLTAALLGPTTALLTGRDGAGAVPLAFQVIVSNPGTAPAANVKLKAEFDQSLKHESGHNTVETRLGTLEPGASRTVPLPLTPRRGGEALCRVTATADGLTAQDERAVRVAEALLTLRLSGPAVRFVGRPLQWEIDVSNDGDLALEQVEVHDLLPPEIDADQASGDGRRQGREVVWQVGALGPHESRKLRLGAVATHAAERSVNQVTATATVVDAPAGAVRLTGNVKDAAAPTVQAQAEAALQVRGVEALTLRAAPEANPIMKGERTRYRITVTNTGSLTAGDVQLECKAGDGLRIVAAAGPSANRREDSRVLFAPLPALAADPAVKLEYTVDVEAVRPGDARFRVELTTSTLREPIFKEETLNVR
jgi:hypothetical protein